MEIQGKANRKKKKWIVIGAFSWIGALGYAVCLSEKTGVLYSASFNYGCENGI